MRAQISEKVHNPGFKKRRAFGRSPAVYAYLLRCRSARQFVHCAVRGCFLPETQQNSAAAVTLVSAGLWSCGLWRRVCVAVSLRTNKEQNPEEHNPGVLLPSGTPSDLAVPAETLHWRLAT
jgi:hypothetical protein